jgi:hypothetical protein
MKRNASSVAAAGRPPTPHPPTHLTHRGVLRRASPPQAAPLCHLAVVTARARMTPASVMQAIQVARRPALMIAAYGLTVTSKTVAVAAMIAPATRAWKAHLVCMVHAF